MKCGRNGPAAMIAAAMMTFGLSTPVTAQPAPADQRRVEDEIIYLIMPDRFENGDPSNDRGGLKGGPEVTGFDPTHKGFYHGGDLKGLTQRLDYIKDLGATAIWLTPVFRNKPVQGLGAHQSAGYHGYWALDFLDIDPHLGTKQDYRNFIAAAKARGLKIYLDIVVNHTADVIAYRECPDRGCAYRPQGEYPYSRHGGLTGAPINDGFIGVGPLGQNLPNFARLTRMDYAYTPFVPNGQEKAKNPAWLNDIAYYHNRGESTFKGESSLMGDFAGLDDVMTEHPRVVQGFIDIYSHWIDEYDIDGFRIDTARHVNPEFWQAFIPAIQARARARGIRDFHIFGEVMEFDPGELARFTHVDGLPAVNDFALFQAISDVVAKGAATRQLAKVFRGDELYKGGEATARTLVTLIGNHDVLRLGRTLRAENPQASEAELLQRMILANALLLHSRGVPALYYGDEQGFTGEGEGDQPSREDMFPSKTASYNDNRLIGSDSSTAVSNFDQNHPFYRAIASMTRARHADPALRRGAQVTRAYTEEGPGLFGFSRLLEGTGETLVMFNSATKPITASVQVETRSMEWNSLAGSCAPASTAPGSYSVTVPALSYILCKAK